MSDEEQQLPQSLPTREPNAGTKAREQAANYEAVFTSTRLDFDNGDHIMVPPHPTWRLLDDDQMDAYDALIFEQESYDRAEDVDVPEQTVYARDGKGEIIKDIDGKALVVTVIPASTRPGPLLIPYRKGGELITPSWEVRIVKVALGDDDYAKLRANHVNGRRGTARDVMGIWRKQNAQLQEREAADSKSEGSPVAVGPVPKADS